MMRFCATFILMMVAFVTTGQTIVSDSITGKAVREILSAAKEESRTPLYIINAPIAFNCDAVTARFADCRFRELDQAELKLCEEVELKTDMAIESGLIKTRNHRGVQLQFSPFSRNSNGDLMVLTDFKISVSAYRGSRVRGADSESDEEISDDESLGEEQYAGPSNSMLSSGRWFKIKVDTSGVYKLTYDDLIKIGIDNPQDTRIFSYGGRNLPLYCGQSSLTDLNEIPTYKSFGADSVFDKNDYLLFYAQGPVVLDYNADYKLFVHTRNSYSDYIYLMLTSDFGPGLDMRIEEEGCIEPEAFIASYDIYASFDKGRYNLVSSGRRWYDKKLMANSFDSARFDFPSIYYDEPVRGVMYAAGRKMNGATAYFRLRYLGNEVAVCNVNRSYDDYRYADFCEKDFSIDAVSPHIYISYGLLSSNLTSEGYINKICLNARTQLSYNGKKQFHFRNSRTAGNDTVVYEVRNNGNTPFVIDVTNPVKPFLLSVSHSDTVTSFVSCPRDSIREYIAFDERNLLTPIMSGEDVGVVENQNLHGASTPDMLIVTHPDFVQQAEDLADLHRDYDGFDVQVVTQQQIFNEFSGGTPDVAAIRDYARLLYSRGDKFKYLLLFGDGTYDNRNITGANANFILTYQTENSESQSESCVSDDFFGMLDDGEGDLIGTMDIAVGGLPAASQDEAAGMVNKIKSYLTERDFGGWCNTIAIIADDEEDGDFVYEAEKMCRVIEKTSPEYNINKIYIDSYEQLSGASGASYPRANEDVKKQFSNGAAIVTYVGHGGQRKLAHESVVLLQDVNAMTNIGRLPFVVTASCEVGRFDDHTFTSLGECLIKNQNGAAIAALVTTRVVYNSANGELCRNVFAQKLNRDMRIGDIVMNAKNATGTVNSINKRNFVLLGDPALRLTHPYNTKAMVTKINGKKVGVARDTINAVDTVTIEGQICDVDGNLLEANGILYTTVYDKKIICSTRGNDRLSPIIDFEVQNSALFQGRATIVNGYYKFSFIMPKDINYSYGPGKISLYAELDSHEAVGYSEEIFIGGTPNDAKLWDNNGPEIKLFVTDTNFVDGYVVGSNPQVIAKLFDESGINTTGNGVGHDIVAVIDYDMRSAMVLNDCYEGYIDNYNSGEIRFNLYGLEDGEHTLTLTAWDVYNNPSESEVVFVVRNGQTVAIGDVYNYPNPVETDTYFYVNHNQTDNAVEVRVTIYDMQGRKIDMIQSARGVGDTSSLYWPGVKNGRRLDSGIYLYVVEVSTPTGKSSKSGKMVIARQ